MNKQRWQIRLGDEAEKDFVRILAYTKDNFGLKQAEIYRVTLLDAIAALGEGPNVPGSSARDDLPANIRTLHIARRGRRGRHFIMYRPGQGTTIEIVRILHDAMDFARHIPPDAD